MSLSIRLLLSFLVFISAPIYAALDLELTQGIQGAMPIAVVPFANQEKNLNSPENIANVVANDLTNSGRFKIPSLDSLQQFPHTSQNIDYDYWKQLNMNDLVVGSVIPQGKNKFKVTFQLIDIYAGQAEQKNPNVENAILIEKQFSGIDKNRLRSLAHHISDLIYQQLTGDRGIFSTRLAYVIVDKKNGVARRYKLEVSDVDGYNPKPLISSKEPIMSPAWSPDGKSIAYVSFEGDESAIYVQNVATGARRLITRFPGINGAPAWSPNGQQLAVVLTKTGNPKIFLVNLASGGLTQLTDGYSIDTEPSFSPDGTSLLFTSDRGGGPEIYQLNLASRQIQRLTYSGKYNARASFAADGNSIVMLTQDSSGYDIALQDLASGRVTLLTDSGNTQSPTLAPNGKMIAYADQYQGQGVLGIASIDGRIKLRLPSEDGDVQEPAWSPFLN
jgi:TolB protein